MPLLRSGLQTKPPTTGSAFHEHTVDTATFSCFRKLPSELRSIVWSMALASRRYVAVIPVWDKETKTPRLQIRAKPEQIMRVCRESREAALKEYTRITFNQEGGYVLVNLSRDMIHLEILPVTCIPVQLFEILCRTHFITVDDLDYMDYYGEIAAQESSSLEVANRGLTYGDSSTYTDMKRVIDELDSGRVIAARISGASGRDISIKCGPPNAWRCKRVNVL
jgi:hypothetical protein